MGNASYWIPLLALWQESTLASTCLRLQVGDPPRNEARARCLPAFLSLDVIVHLCRALVCSILSFSPCRFYARLVKHTSYTAERPCSRRQAPRQLTLPETRHKRQVE